ncbi:hypothetical protein B0H10DRAFT_2209593 [Mycena sp. CBHHK59/15]|nr:hypothetical protein B0H10DRAFT_2209593 [Mycena sp. CBHHK59/15]
MDLINWMPLKPNRLPPDVFLEPAPDFRLRCGEANFQLHERRELHSAREILPQESAAFIMSAKDIFAEGPLPADTLCVAGRMLCGLGADSVPLRFEQPGVPTLSETWYIYLDTDPTADGTRFRLYCTLNSDPLRIVAIRNVTAGECLTTIELGSHANRTTDGNLTYTWNTTQVDVHEYRPFGICTTPLCFTLDKDYHGDDMVGSDDPPCGDGRIKTFPEADTFHKRKKRKKPRAADDPLPKEQLFVITVQPSSITEGPKSTEAEAKQVFNTSTAQDKRDG